MLRGWGCKEPNLPETKWLNCLPGETELAGSSASRLRVSLIRYAKYLYPLWDGQGNCIWIVSSRFERAWL